ncbi:MAG: 16S rRNA (guanine(527)-N(7))-methyltransferase RsmG [Candidatus Eisenbacteria bacterium]
MTSRRGSSRSSTRRQGAPYRGPRDRARVSRGSAHPARTTTASRASRRAAPGTSAARKAASRTSASRTRARGTPASRSTAPGAIDQTLARQPWDSLNAPLLRAGVDVTRAIQQLRDYARLLLDWNRSASNLISHNDEPRIVERHLLESIAPAHWLKESGCARWIDFGSGAGLPAIPLAIAGVRGHWTLVESRRTKTLFIRKALQELSLGHLVTVNDRLENFVEDQAHAAAFDGFTSRATLKLVPTLALAARVIAPGGSAFLWKGSGREQEMEQDAGWQGAWEFTGLLGVGSGPNVVVRFIRKTND